MSHIHLLHVMLLARSVASGKSFHIGPWIIVPLLFLLAIIGTPIFIMRDRRKRRSARPVK
jgi:Flp pilus assembly protein TadB